MKQLFIKRVSPSFGQVYAHTFNDGEQIVTKIIPYDQCLDYVKIHQKDLIVYKIGYMGVRKNAKRKQLGRILATDQVQAVKLFRGQISGYYEPGTYQLFTGDWKEILTIKKEN